MMAAKNGVSALNLQRVLGPEGPRAAARGAPAVQPGQRWLEGTHQGAIGPEHLQSSLDEFIFRFSHRNARRRGLLFLRLLERAVETGPITYRHRRKPFTRLHSRG